MYMPPYISLLKDEGILSLSQIEEAIQQAQAKHCIVENLLISMGYLTKAQLIDAIDRSLNKSDTEQIEDTESGVLRLRTEMQTLTGVVRISKMNHAKSSG